MHYRAFQNHTNSEVQSQNFSLLSIYLADLLGISSLL